MFSAGGPTIDEYSPFVFPAGTANRVLFWTATEDVVNPTQTWAALATQGDPTDSSSPWGFDIQSVLKIADPTPLPGYEDAGIWCVRGASNHPDGL